MTFRPCSLGGRNFSRYSDFCIMFTLLRAINEGQLQKKNEVAIACKVAKYRVFFCIFDRILQFQQPQSSKYFSKMSINIPRTCSNYPLQNVVSGHKTLSKFIWFLAFFYNHGAKSNAPKWLQVWHANSPIYVKSILTTYVLINTNKTDRNMAPSEKSRGPEFSWTCWSKS